MKKLFTHLWSWSLLTLGAAASLTSCRNVEDEYHHYKLYFENNSDTDIVAAFVFVNKNYEDLYQWGYRNSESIKSHESERLYPDGGDYCGFDPGSECWEWCIQKDTVVFHIMERNFKAREDTLEHRLAEYRFSCQDLYELNWRLAYPPTEQMQKYNVKVEDKYLIGEKTHWE